LGRSVRLFCGLLALGLVACRFWVVVDWVCRLDRVLPAIMEVGMGLGDNLDKAKDMAGEHSDQVDQGLDKAGQFVDDKTGHEHTDQIDKGRDAVEQQLNQQPDQR
jgi:hypothetical protein